MPLLHSSGACSNALSPPHAQPPTSPILPALVAIAEAIITDYTVLVLAIALLLVFGVIQLWKIYRHQKQSDDKIHLYAKCFENAQDCFCVVDLDWKIVATNKAFRQLVGCTDDFEFGTSMQFYSSKIGKEEMLVIWEALQAHGEWRGNTWIKTVLGDETPIECKITQVQQDAGQGDYLVYAFADMSSRIQNEKELVRLANYDSLTKLPNRNLFNERIRHAVVNAKRNDSRSFGLMFIDLDRFKAVNDSLSHHHGDMMLLEFANRSQKSLRETDTVARLGGDEFVILVESLNQVEDMSLVAKKLFMQFKHPLILDDESLYISLSVGIAVFPEDGDNADDLIKNADAAMYASKKRGGNTYSFYTERLNHQSLEILKLESDMRTAMLQDQFVVHYQPKINIASGKTIALEALIRWNKPGDGMVAPGLFIEAAERTGLIIQIGLTVIKKVCMQLQEWSEQGIKLGIAVNVSAKQLLEVNFVEQVQEISNQYTFDKSLLEFEITESMIMTDMSTSIFIIATLQQLGHKISVDDFGTGYSSLAYLTQLPIDVLKVDRSFVKDMLTDPDQESIVKTIIQLGKNLNLTLVAEGVEDLETHQRLKELGCDQGQGYYYQRPDDAEVISSFLSTEVGVVEIPTQQVQSQ